MATSAVRDAENGEAFLGEIEWSYGFDTRLLSGDEEAQLTFRGVAAGRELAPGTLVVDVGGGSTELVLADWHRSLDLGCVRLTERFLRSDPPAPAELDACRGHVRAALPAEPRPTHAIGVAGTVTTLAVLSLGLAEENPALVHGHRLQSDWIDEETERLSPCRSPSSERSAACTPTGRRSSSPGRSSSPKPSGISTSTSSR